MKKKITWNQKCYRIWQRWHSFKPGMIYTNCSDHPCLCTEISIRDDEICGISLVDGSYPNSCSLHNCAPGKLTLKQALDWKLNGPPFLRNKKWEKWARNYIKNWDKDKKRQEEIWKRWKWW